MAHVSGWKYWWRRWLGFLPIQFCMICGRWYWGGVPRISRDRRGFFVQWMPWWQDYCSRACADADLVLVDRNAGEREWHQPDWDDRTEELAKFPADRYERIPIKDGNEGRVIVAQRAIRGDPGAMVFAEARWFGPGDGMLFIKRSE